MQSGYKTFYATSRFLKSVSIAKKPIRVRRVNLKDLDGSCEEKKKFFLIKVDKTLTESHAIDVLLHEVAHADAWDQDGEDIHGPHWGICFSRLYKKWEEFNEQQKD